MQLFQTSSHRVAYRAVSGQCMLSRDKLLLHDGERDSLPDEASRSTPSPQRDASLPACARSRSTIATSRPRAAASEPVALNKATSRRDTYSSIKRVDRRLRLRNTARTVPMVARARRSSKKNHVSIQYRLGNLLGNSQGDTKAILFKFFGTYSHTSHTNSFLGSTSNFCSRDFEIV